MQSKYALGLALTIGLLANLLVASPVFAQTPTSTHTWILVTTPAKYCDDSVQSLTAYIQAQAVYLPYIGAYDVVCFPAASDPMQVQENVALMRTVFPTDKLVFVYDLRDSVKVLEFEAFLGTTDGFNHDTALGKAFIDDGYAVAAFNGEIVAHEAAHIVTKTVHYDFSTRDEPSLWKPYVS